MDVMFLIEPLPEWHHHVQQHFVAISHQQRPGHVKSSMSKDCSHTLPGKGWGGAERHDSHCSNARAAATSTSGFTSIPSAQASRSGSCPSRNVITAASVAWYPTPARMPSGVSPVNSNTSPQETLE